MTTDLMLALDAAEALHLLADEVKRIRRAIQDAAGAATDQSNGNDGDGYDAAAYAHELMQAEKTILYAVKRIEQLKQRAKERGKVVERERKGEPK